MSFLNRLKTWQLLIGLLIVIFATTMFIVAVSGKFSDNRIELSPEYLCGENCEVGFMELNIDEYDRLVAEKKSFVVFVDQAGCVTAGRLGKFVLDFAIEKGIKVYRMEFSDVKKTSLHDFVRYYPSVAVVSKGKVVGALRADADEDSDAYNKYEAFKIWADKYLK